MFGPVFNADAAGTGFYVCAGAPTLVDARTYQAQTGITPHGSHVVRLAAGDSIDVPLSAPILPGASFLLGHTQVAAVGAELSLSATAERCGEVTADLSLPGSQGHDASASSYQADCGSLRNYTTAAIVHVRIHNQAETTIDLIGLELSRGLELNWCDP